jgi:hypothetical protein
MHHPTSFLAELRCSEQKVRIHCLLLTVANMVWSVHTKSEAQVRHVTGTNGKHFSTRQALGSNGTERTCMSGSLLLSCIICLKKSTSPHIVAKDCGCLPFVEKGNKNLTFFSPSGASACLSSVVCQFERSALSSGLCKA